MVGPAVEHGCCLATECNAAAAPAVSRPLTGLLRDLGQHHSAGSLDQGGGSGQLHQLAGLAWPLRGLLLDLMPHIERSPLTPCCCGVPQVWNLIWGGFQSYFASKGCRRLHSLHALRAS